MDEARGDGSGRGPGGKPNVPIPYDFENHSPAPLRSKDDIIEFDRAFRAITADLPKPILLGSVMRLAEATLPDWGIELTAENRQALVQYAESFYRMDDIEYTPEKVSRDTLQVFKRQLQESCLTQMEANSSLIITNMLRSSEDRKSEVSICNLAAGAANVVRSVITKLGCDGTGKGILERTVFHLVDRPEKLALIERNLRRLGARLEWHAKSSAEFLSEMKGGRKKFDYVVSVSEFHRKPFLSDHLRSIHSIMNERALLVAADWHSPLTMYPSGVYELLKVLNVPNQRLSDFEDLFGPFMLRDCRQENSTEENRALCDHMGYWRNLASSMGNASTDQQGLKIRIMSAFLTQKQLAGQLEQSGFDTDRDKIRAAFPPASANALPGKFPVRIQNRSDTAVVTLAMRR